MFRARIDATPRRDVFAFVAEQERIVYASLLIEGLSQCTFA